MRGYSSKSCLNASKAVLNIYIKDIKDICLLKYFYIAGVLKAAKVHPQWHHIPI